MLMKYICETDAVKAVPIERTRIFDENCYFCNRVWGAQASTSSPPILICSEFIPMCYETHVSPHRCTWQTFTFSDVCILLKYKDLNSATEGHLFYLSGVFWWSLNLSWNSWRKDSQYQPSREDRNVVRNISLQYSLIVRSSFYVP